MIKNNEKNLKYYYQLATLSNHTISFRNSDNLSLNDTGRQELIHISPELTEMLHFSKHK